MNIKENKIQIRNIFLTEKEENKDKYTKLINVLNKLYRIHLKRITLEVISIDFTRMLTNNSYKPQII